MVTENINAVTNAAEIAEASDPEKSPSHASQEAVSKPVEDVPPNGGYGWVCVAMVFIINCHTWGLNSAYGVFLSHYLKNSVFAGATPLTYAFVGGLSISQALLISPIATVMTRVFSTRVTLLLGVLLQTVSFIGASFATKLWQLILSQGLCFGYGMGLLFVGSVGIIPQWFTTKRSLANGVSTAGSGFGGLVYSLAANAIIKRIGLAWAFRILGIVSGVANAISAILLKDRNVAVGSVQVPFDLSLFKRMEYWLLLGWACFSMLGYVAVLFSLPSYAISVGLSAQQASVVGAILNLGQMIGRPPVGYFSDAAGRINMAAIMTFFAAFFSFVIWIFAKSYGVLLFYAILGGTVVGVFWTTIGPVQAEVVGLKNIPAALSMTWLVLVLPTTFSEPIALQITTSNGGDYLGAQLFASFMYIGAAACLTFLRAWKIGDLERTAALANKPIASVGVLKEIAIDGSETGTDSEEVMLSPYWSRFFSLAKV